MISQEAKGHLLDHPQEFLLHYFPHRIDTIKPFHQELIRLASDERRGIELYPATHGKTTLISELLPLHEICRNPNIRIGGLFKDERTARAIVRSQQAEMQTNERLIADFGPFVPKGDGAGKLWTQSRYDVEGRTRRGSSSTFAGFGAGSRGALGYRTDWVLADDVVTDRNSSTPEQRENLREWFMQGPMTMCDLATGRMTVVGTAFHPSDLYHELMNVNDPSGEGKLWVTKIQKAILDWDKEEVLWPELRPMLQLMEYKAVMGTLDFNKRFQNLALDPSQLVFREEYVKGGVMNGQKYPGCLDEGYRLGDRDPEWKVYTGFDPAIGKSRGTKFCAHVTLGVGSCREHERCFWLIDLKRDQMTMPQQVALIIQQHELYGAMKSTIEANVFQAALEQQVRQKVDEMDLAMVIAPHYTTKTNKPDPVSGVMAMSNMVEQGKLHIPWGDAASRGRMQILIDEMIMYPEGSTTDTVMALWFAWRSCQLQAPKFKVANRFTNGHRWVWPEANPFGMQKLKNPAYE